MTEEKIKISPMVMVILVAILITVDVAFSYWMGAALSPY